jgi:hypothetical protein
MFVSILYILKISNPFIFEIIHYMDIYNLHKFLQGIKFRVCIFKIYIFTIKVSKIKNLVIHLFIYFA